MPRKRRSWLYVKRGRYYGDFRSFSEVGGKLEALVPPGERFATTDAEIAERLVANRLEGYRRQRKRLAYGEPDGDAPRELGPFAEHYLRERAETGAVTDRHLQVVQGHLQRAVEHFGMYRPLDLIRPADVKRYVAWLLQHPSGRGGKLSRATVRKHLNSLGRLYRSAIEYEVVSVGYNPVAALSDKPRAEQREARWLEPYEAALLLQAARRAVVPRDGIPYLYELLATALYTGARKRAVLGLLVGDVNFERGVVHFRPNRWRQLKTPRATRAVPLWPRLRAALTEYLANYQEVNGKPPKEEALLFPSPKTGVILHDFQKAIDRAAALVGFGKREITPHLLRHTYCATRLQTLDQGLPVSPYRVARELGHSSVTLLERTYGHLLQHPKRTEVVEYSLEGLPEHLRPMLRLVEDDVA
ncbi:tyrosine-type recombinase/integrase [Gemmatimonadota bacterium]